VINLLVDECYAFDYLAILNVKLFLDENNAQKKISFDKCCDFLKGQMGNLFDTVLKSDEFKNCFEANLKTFDAVDKAKTDQVPASYVDHCNYLRHLAKIDLQKKFFIDNITEQKIGYEVYGDHQKV